VIDEARMKPGSDLVVFSAMNFLHCIDTGGWVAGRASGLLEYLPLIPTFFFQNKWRKKEHGGTG